MNAKRLASVGLVLAAVTISGLLVWACSGLSDEVDTDVDGNVTIKQGLYGQYVLYDPTRDADDQGPFANQDAVITITVNGTTTMTTTTTDETGFYQAMLDAGVYVMCTAWGECITFTVPTGLIRIDNAFNKGGFHVVSAPDAGS